MSKLIVVSLLLCSLWLVSGCATPEQEQQTMKALSQFNSIGYYNIGAREAAKGNYDGAARNNFLGDVFRMMGGN